MKKDSRPLKKSEKLFQRACKIIPGGAQTFSKSSIQHIRGVSPLFLKKGKGSKVWDVDGNKYIDYIQGLLPNILGYAHKEVNRAFISQVNRGHSFSLPHPIECLLAEKLSKIIPCAEMVRFGKNGSDATSGAVRLARAFTGRERIACCGYHGWQDWFIGSTARPEGVPKEVRKLTHPFPYNDLGALEKILEAYPGQFAAVILEPVNFDEPHDQYLNSVKKMVQKHGAILIFDEICCGFHLGLGGAQKFYRVTPDLACFGKAMGNGFPISALVGKKEIMRNLEKVFFSFTFAGEVASMAAACKVIEILEKTDILEKMQKYGDILKNGLNKMAKQLGLGDRVICRGHSRWSQIKFTTSSGQDDIILRSLFQQEAAKKGILILTTHNICGALSSKDISQTLNSYEEILLTLSEWMQDPNPQKYLEGPAVRPVFKVR